MKQRTALFAALLAFITTLSACAASTSPKPAAPDGICASPARSGELAQVSDVEYFDSFTPVLRFAVASDVHVTDTGMSSQEEQRLQALFDTAYAYADGHKAYLGLDGVFFAGDVSDRGTRAGLERFFSIAAEKLREGTVLRATMGNHEFYDDADTARETFLGASGYASEDAHLTLGGYHFVFLSPDEKGKGYSQEKQTFLSQALREAAAEDPTGCKPIFVFQHHPASDTVYGSSTSWGVEELTGILESYPQVVDFSGHSHFPLNDPRSVWQDSFTALGCGTLSYYEMDLAGIKDDYVFPTNQLGSYADKATGHRDAGQFYIVEVDANHAIQILGYDLISGGWMMDPITLRCVDETSCYSYTAARADHSPAPLFSSDAVVTETYRTDGIVTLSFPQATCEDLVQHYRCTLYADGVEQETVYRLACTCFLPTPETLNVTFKDLTPGSAYCVEIRAVNAWQVVSEPLTYEWLV